LFVRINKEFFFFLFHFSYRSLGSCLESIHCPLNIKSYGSLILNLLHLLRINNCDLNFSCPNEKRVHILQNLLTHWTDIKLINNADYQEENTAEIDNYCP
jgi:hypothetical protein